MQTITFFGAFSITALLLGVIVVVGAVAGIDETSDLGRQNRQTRLAVAGIGTLLSILGLAGLIREALSLSTTSDSEGASSDASESPIAVAAAPVTSEVAQTSIPEATNTAEVTEYIVYAMRAWQNSGVTLGPGDWYDIQYLAGEWDWTSNYPDFDARGDPNPRNTCRSIAAPGQECPVFDAPAGILVARIDDNVPFVVGEHVEGQYTSNDNEAHTLYLMINDVENGLHDNDGKLQISIRVSRNY